MNETNSAPTNNQTILLRDGRRLGYIEYGDSQGKPLFYFHGHPTSRLETQFLAEDAAALGVRLIGVDRPGFGLSTYKAKRHLLEWPLDVVELADHLQLERFGVVGFSGGGPYALACAFKIADRLTACGVVSGVGRTGPFRAFLAIWLPWLILPVARGLFKTEEKAIRTLTRAARSWVEPDRQALAKPGVMKIMAASLVEGLRQGARGAAYDGRLIGSRNWGFELEEIKLPQIYLWHGELDREIPVSQVRKLVERLQPCQPKYYPNEGHISTLVNHQQKILTTLTVDKFP